MAQARDDFKRLEASLDDGGKKKKKDDTKDKKLEKGSSKALAM